MMNSSSAIWTEKACALGSVMLSKKGIQESDGASYQKQSTFEKPNSNFALLNTLLFHTFGEESPQTTGAPLYVFPTWL